MGNFRFCFRLVDVRVFGFVVARALVTDIERLCKASPNGQLQPNDILNFFIDGQKVYASIYKPDKKIPCHPPFSASTISQFWWLLVQSSMYVLQLFSFSSHFVSIVSSGHSIKAFAFISYTYDPGITLAMPKA
jgi:hypothetical protein